MQLTTVAIHVLFLAFPGILASKFYRKLRGGSLETWGVLFEVLIFTMASYLIVVGTDDVLHWVVRLFGTPPATQPTDLGLSAEFSDEHAPLPWGLILLACPVATVLALVGSYSHNHRWITRVGQYIGVSTRIADEDLWEMLHSSTIGKWVIVRDLGNKRIYWGVVRMYSESGEDRELLMIDVDIFDEATMRSIDTAKTVYLCQSKELLVVQIPNEPVAAADPVGNAGRGS